MTRATQTSFPILDRILDAEAEGTRDLLAEVLSGDTYTAEHVSATLTDAGFPVSASTIRTYRRSLRQKEKR